MAYGHAERTLATIRLLEAETIELLRTQQDLAPEQEQWLREEAAPRTPGNKAVATPRTAPSPPVQPS